MAKKRMTRSQEYVKKSLTYPNVAHEEREKRRARREDELFKREREENSNTHISKRKRSKNIRRRLLYLFVISAILLLVGIQVFNIGGLLREKGELTKDRDALLKEKTRLMEELKNVNSKEYIEQKAREQLRLIKPDEILFIFPGDNADDEN